MAERGHALVTGASRGLGRAAALRLAREGWSVSVGYLRRDKDALKVVAEIESAGGEAQPLGFDVCEAEAVRAAIDAIVDARGGLDLVVNNAGIARDGMFGFDDPTDWTETMRANLDGVAHVCRHAGRQMLTQGRGIIINVSSAVVDRATPGRASYVASKSGVIGLTRALALEWAGRGVRVNAIVPGMFSEGMFARMRRDLVERWTEHIPAGRAGTGEEFAGVVSFLASDDARYIHGQSLVVDGGLTL